MASNFKVQVQKRKDDLHLLLEGDFDGDSAHQVIRLIGNGCRSGRVFIHTNGLREIHPFGRKVFQKNLSAYCKDGHHLVFMGRKSSLIAPPGSLSGRRGEER